MQHQLNTVSRWVIAAIFLSGLATTAQARTAKGLTGCASESPPFVVMKDGVGSTGFSVEVVSRLAQQIGRLAIVRDLPWARCLSEVKAGRIDVAVDAYEDAERRKSFLYSNPYYTLTPQIFYPKGPKGPSLPAKTVDDLKKLRGCGIHEYTYEHYGLDEKKLDRGAKSNKQMISMLLANRCDYALEELEYIIGGRMSEKDWPDETSLSSYQPEWASRPQLHLLVGQEHREANDLLSELNTGLAELEKAGAIRQLQSKYFPSGNKPSKRAPKSTEKSPAKP